MCDARQYSDQMMCSCGLSWDVNDPDPPNCPAGRKPIKIDRSTESRSRELGRRTFEKLRSMLK